MTYDFDSLRHMSRDDLAEALPDFLRLASGSPVRQSRLHPIAAAAYSERLSLQDLKMRSGMTSADFASGMESGLSQLMLTKFSARISEVQSITATKYVDDFKETDFLAVSLSEPAEEATDNPDVPFLTTSISENVRTGQLRSFSGRLRFSRPVWKTWSGELMNAIDQYGSAIFPGLERKVLAETLEAGTWTAGNGALSISSLNDAAKLLRNSTNDAGQKSNLPIYAIAIPTELEMTARSIRQTFGWPDLKIVVLPDLSSDTTWFAIADPSISAPIIRMVLRSSPDPRVYSNPRLIEGAEFLVQHDFNFVEMSGVPGVVVMTL